MRTRNRWGSLDAVDATAQRMDAGKRARDQWRSSWRSSWRSPAAVMALALCALCIPACTPRTPENTSAAAGYAGAPWTAPGAPAAAGNAVTPPRPAMTPYNALRSWPSVARSVEQVQGLKWAVVLQEGRRVYVGAFPDHDETPEPDRAEAPRTRYDFPKAFDTPAELAQKTPDDFIRALEDPGPRADTRDFRPRDRSGMLSPAKQMEVRQRVQRALPDVQTVLITTDTASAAVLRGYAEYLEAGGDMSRFMDQFHKRVALIWPNGRGTDPYHPSASPDFGALGTPADARTPLHGPVG
ncbi:hypothetical protein [Alicyclobacillus sp.]|uniref:hypothetical protein n=1 Tax=Alicyclobacillus sp. TaxID=61169 RepID=UPI0025BEA05D|nr:hypothetical protein [Alicyclobacillus sp.]MCL6517128.1 hypothetical protein [Alicyclobacillus sp.]